jgi:hypothetical protein
MSVDVRYLKKAPNPHLLKMVLELVEGIDCVSVKLTPWLQTLLTE